MAEEIKKEDRNDMRPLEEDKVDHTQDTSPQTVQQLSDNDLKVVCFDVSERIKSLQATYQTCYNELIKRSSK